MKISIPGTLRLILFLILIPSVECAYIDPGTGSYFIQVLIAALAGGALAVKIFWRRIVAFLKGETRKKAEPEERHE
jgi:hypothetical protein